MHMKDIIVQSPGKPRELLDKGQTPNSAKFPNIPFDEYTLRKKDDKDEESDSDNEGKYYNYSEKDNELYLQLSKLRLSSDTKDESDEEEKPDDDQVVAKGLQDNKELRRGKRAESLRPYPVVQNMLCNWLDRGDVHVDNVFNYDPNDAVSNITLPAVEHGAPSAIGPTLLEDYTPEMQDFETSLIDFKFDVDDLLSIQKAIEANEQSSYITLESSLPNTLTSTDLVNEYCDSTRDSGYATSPTNSNQSIHSPQSSVYSRHSPDPRGIPKYDNRLPSYFPEYENELKTRPECYNQQEAQNYPCKPVLQLQPAKDGYDMGRFSNGYQQFPETVHNGLLLPQAPVCSISVDLTDMPARAQRPYFQRQNVPKPIQPNHQQQAMPITPKDNKPNKYSYPTKYLQPTTEKPVYENEYVKPASERIGKLMKRNKVETLNITISCESTETFCSIKENQTKIMQLLLIKEIPQDFIERVYVRLQRVKRNKHVSLLKHRDAENRNALFIAATVHKTRPIISRFIADVYSHLETSPDESYANDNSLFHILAGESDECANVLAELLHATMPDKTKCFNVNSTNKVMLTPLHIATMTHNPPSKFAYSICRLLVNHGANLTIQDNEGDTPLHIAIKKHCDPVFIKALLNSNTARQCVNMTDNNNNTPLHLAAKRNDIPLEKQKEVIKHLTSSHAQYDIQNRDGKVALSLVSVERKEEIRKILQHRI
ncbi:uncharacterized protein LOC106672678 [Cimex lectularius]|uniref:Uncharacterized protein n=1 Tax=Cimex lectularius TaxID=79782 RepID=A0A8I6SG43_CIMLE|nr:uncharacterized protein LOC106672678 [Cimex lectularius]XP_024086392.1 uncharacterized protein LOC106672678 [Cimex lectularius]